jgi:small neutral amino acid transporter SnatA (MarC family)
METFYEALVSFLAILNPFALCLYLEDVMAKLERKGFVRVLGSACLFALVVFWLFAYGGEPFLRRVLRVRPEALRVFGGMIFLVVGYNYAVKGYRTAELLRGSLEELPAAIAMPLMIGAGTITQSILIGKALPMWEWMLVLGIGVAASFGIVVAFKVIRDHVRARREALFDRYVAVLARINGLVIGAISVNMIVTGLHALWETGDAKM